MTDISDTELSESGSEAEARPLAPAPALSRNDDVDFLLHPAELAKGRRAAENYLSSFRSDETRKVAEEALETLATVISGGKCDSVEFPWQQVQPYHGAAALTILKKKGAPARVESLRCRRDTTRSYRVVPEAYPPRQVQKIRSTLSKVIEQCAELGFVLNDEPVETTAAPSKAKKTAKKSAPAGGRLLGDGEVRALVAACAAAGDAAGHRDAVLFSLVYRGLKIAEITALTFESVKFSNKTGICSIVAKPSRGGSRGRRIDLTNDELIILEDWLDHRGDKSGALLSTVVKNKVEGKRLTTALLKTICEERAKKATVPEFAPNDLSRSAEALESHRKSAKRKAARKAQENLSSAEKALYLASSETDADALNEAIQFPFLGLNI
jgi:site-specific recombinase XerC